MKLIYPEESAEDLFPETLPEDVIPEKVIDWNALNSSVEESIEETRRAPVFKNAWSQKTEGNITEELFIFKCKSLGLSVQKASIQEDYYDHCDFKIEKFNKTNIKLDVKGLKSLRRNGLKQNKYFFVELHENGWLKNGKSDYIAIQFSQKKFLIFDKKKLLEYALKVVKFDKPVVAWPEQSLERVYVRKGPNVTTVLSLLDTVKAYENAGIGTL
jgi:hypothetical protein